MSSLCREIITPEIVQQHSNGRPQPPTTLLVVQVLPCTITHNTPPYTSSQSNTQSPVSHQHSQSTIHVQTPTLRINAPYFVPNLHQPPPPPLAQNNQPTIIQTNNKFIHRQHNHLIHIFHNHSTHKFHHRISHNTHLLTVHL